MIEVKTKKILWLMSIVIIIALVTFGCKKKPTDAGNVFSGEQTAGQKKLNIDFTQGLSQFEGLSFKSGGYVKNGDYSKLIYYYAYVKVDAQLKPYISVVKKDSDGNIVEDQGEFYSVSNESGAVYNLEGVKYNGSSKITAEFIFTEEGYLNIKFDNYSLDITCSLAEKTEIVGKKLNIDFTQGLSQFEGLSFKSGGYVKNGDYSKLIYYYAYVKVDAQLKPYISVVKKDSDGNIVEDQGEFYSVANESGAVYNLEGVKYNGSSKITAEFIFTEEGYLNIKFDNYSLDITCPLAEK